MLVRKHRVQVDRPQLPHAVICCTRYRKTFTNHAKLVDICLFVCLFFLTILMHYVREKKKEKIFGPVSRVKTQEK